VVPNGNALGVITHLKFDLFKFPFILIVVLLFFVTFSPSRGTQSFLYCDKREKGNQKRKKRKRHKLIKEKLADSFKYYRLVYCEVGDSLVIN